MKKLNFSKKTVVTHSGGMDSSICLKMAIEEFGVENVLALSFSYHQRHQQERSAAQKICAVWGVERIELDLNFYNQITQNALLDASLMIEHLPNLSPNTLVVGRNGLMAQIGSILAHHLGASSLYMGVIGVEASNSGYRDCSRAYMNLVQELVRIDLGNPHFEIRTPLVDLTKKETLEKAFNLGVLEFLLEETVTCYEGLKGRGCQVCPACLLRNEGVLAFFKN